MNKLHRYEYLLSSLPGLEPIGSIPPMSKRDFLERVVYSNGPVDTVEVLLLGDDIAQFEALSTEEVNKDHIDFAVLSPGKAESGPVLPEFLLPEESVEQHENERLSVDEIWSRYFNHAALVAKRAQSGFLKDWIGFEVGLRNALVTARAQILELDPVAYMVTPQLADNDMDYSFIISAWSAASNPLAALEVLDKARWNWLEQHGKWYSFSACEIEVYAARLILLHHWRRILSSKEQQNKNSAALT